MKEMLKILRRCILLVIVIVIIIVIIPSKLNATESDSQKTLLFSADIHGKLDNLNTWLNSMKLQYGTKVDSVAYGGDYADTFNISVIQSIRVLTKNYFPGANQVYALGNHEWKQDESNKIPIDGLPFGSSGVKVNTNNYAIFAVSASSWKQEISLKDIDLLNKFLDNTNKNKPVFVVAHYPLHTYTFTSKSTDMLPKTRTTKNAKRMIEILNRHPNVIYLWGHNHTRKDTNYGTIKVAGDVIEYKPDQYFAIDFAYASMGCMKDGASLDIYGLSANINDKENEREVQLSYTNLTNRIGEPVTISFLK